MVIWLMLLTIGLPWVGTLLVWGVGDKHARAQHTLAVVFSVVAGLAALVLPFYTTDTVALRVSMGGIFGDFLIVTEPKLMNPRRLNKACHPNSPLL